MASSATCSKPGSRSALDDPVWIPLRDDLTLLLSRALADTDPQAALAQFEAARRLYLRKAIDGLRSELTIATALVKDLEDKQQLTPDQLKSANASLAAAGTSIDAALTDLDAVKLDTAFDHAKQATDTLQELFKDLGAAKLGGPSPSFATLFKGAVPDIAGEGSFKPAWTPVATRSSQQLSSTITGWDFLVNVIILVVAVFMGIQVLWSGNATWGSFGDQSAAALWGLGLHQVSFDGLHNLTQRFRTTP